MNTTPSTGRTAAGPPVIFWHSDPVLPGETVILSGHGFGAACRVEFRRLPNRRAAALRVAPSATGGTWTAGEVLDADDSCLKAVVPGRSGGAVFLCRVRRGSRISAGVRLNMPDPWWTQGEEGAGRGRAGGWLRVLGKCLHFGDAGRVVLERAATPACSLPLCDGSDYNLTATLPPDLAAGEYRVRVHNGLGDNGCWADAGRFEVLPAAAPCRHRLNVVDYGADPLGKRDSTVAVVQCIERLGALGGGEVFFPRGRYRMDSGLRSYIDTPLLVPAGITLRGEGMDLVSLWWPDRQQQLSADSGRRTRRPDRKLRHARRLQGHPGGIRGGPRPSQRYRTAFRF